MMIRDSYSMKYLVMLLILTGFGFISHAYAELDKSILEPFENSDLVIIGTVIQVNTMPSENKTQYNIKVEEYLKGQKSFDMITAILDETIPVDFPHDPLDYYNRPYFEKDNQVFVYLKQEGATFKISPYSFTIKKPTVVGPPTVIHSTGPQEHYFSQGDEIVISGTIKKGYLYGLEKSNLDSGFYLVVLNERGEQVDSKKLVISPDGNYKFLFQNKGDLRIPGNYSWEINFENGGMGGEFVVVVDSKLWTPLKQLYSGISPDEVTCKAGLELVQKTNGVAACVTFDTREKLIQRNWASDFPIKHIIDSTYWAKTYLVHHTMCAHIGVWEQTEKDMSAWNMTDTDLEKIPIIKSMIEYNSRGLYSSSEYPKTSTVVSDEIQNQHRQNFDNIANSKSDHGSTFWYNGKYYYTDFAIC